MQRPQGRLAAETVYFVLLLPSLDTLRRRNAERSKGDIFHQALQLDSVARSETREVGPRIDTRRLTPAQSVDAILARLATEARVA